MKLKTIFDQLTYGELSQVFAGIGNTVDNSIPDEKKEAVVNHVILGLTDLHTRFKLKRKFLDVQLIVDQATYVLDETYTDDLLKIEGIKDPDGYFWLADSQGEVIGFYCSDYRTITRPSLEDYEYDFFTVGYRADHPPIDIDAAIANPETTEINLSPAYLNALLLFIASRVHTPIGISKEFHDGNNYASKYEMECQRLAAINLDLDDVQIRDDFSSRGWV